MNIPKIIFSHRWKTILLCVLFNLLFEFSMRTASGFLRQPILLVLLPTVYISYFAMFEDLIVRYHLRDYQVVVVGFIFGMFYMMFGSGAMFAGPLVFDVNLNAIVFIGILWWGMIQGVLTFYFANRIDARDWQHAMMGKKGWIAGVLVNAAVLCLLWYNPYLPIGSTTGYIIGAGFAALAALLLIWDLRRKSRSAAKFEQSLALDSLSFGSVLFFVLMGISFLSDNQLVGATYGSPTATMLVIRWTLILFLGLLVYIYMRRKPISV